MYRMSWSVSASRLALGVLTLGFGMVVTLDRLGLVSVGSIATLWPLAVLALGLVFFAETPRRGLPVTGVWLVGLGAWLVMNQLVGMLVGSYVAALGDIVRGAWPVLFVFAGIGMALHTLIGMASSNATPRVSGDVPMRLGRGMLVGTVAREGRNGR